MKKIEVLFLGIGIGVLLMLFLAPLRPEIHIRVIDSRCIESESIIRDGRIVI
jgi:hypothetical protein